MNLYETLLEYPSLYLAARPGMGITTFAVNLAGSYLKSQNGSVVIFSCGYQKISGKRAGNLYKERLISYFLGGSFFDAIDSMKVSGRIDNSSPGGITIKEADFFTVDDIYKTVFENESLGLIIIDAPLIFDLTDSDELCKEDFSELLHWLGQRRIKLILTGKIGRVVEKRFNKIPNINDFGKEYEPFSALVTIFRYAYYKFKLQSSRGGIIRVYPKGNKRVWEKKMIFDFEYQKITEKTRL